MRQVEKDTIMALIKAYDAFVSHVRECQEKLKEDQIRSYDIDIITRNELEKFIFMQICKVEKSSKLREHITMLLTDMEIQTERKAEQIISLIEGGKHGERH